MKEKNSHFEEGRDPGKSKDQINRVIRRMNSGLYCGIFCNHDSQTLTVPINKETNRTRIEKQHNIVSTILSFLIPLLIILLKQNTLLSDFPLYFVVYIK